MSYGSQTRNPHEHDETPLEPDDRFPCPHCEGWMVDGDPANVRLPDGTLICDSCASTHPVIVAELDRAFRADVARDDDFNQTRR